MAVSLAACGNSTMGNRAGIDRDGGRTVTDTSGRNNTASDTWGGTGDGTMSDNWNGTATDTNRNGTMSGGTSDNWGGTTSGGTADNWNGTATDTNRNGTATDNRRTASENWNDTAGGRDGDTGTRSVTERASDALEDGVRRARDGVENARESVNR